MIFYSANLTTLVSCSKLFNKYPPLLGVNLHYLDFHLLSQLHISCFAQEPWNPLLLFPHKLCSHTATAQHCNCSSEGKTSSPPYPQVKLQSLFSLPGNSPLNVSYIYDWYVHRRSTHLFLAGSQTWPWKLEQCLTNSQCLTRRQI